MPVTLRGRSGPIPLDVPAFTLGRAPTNQLVLDEVKASAYHAVLQQQGEHYSITDLGSSNGTYLNEQRLEVNAPALLKHGDSIRIGETVYTYEESSSFVSTLPPTKEADRAPASEQDSQPQLPDDLQSMLSPPDSRSAEAVPPPVWPDSGYGPLPAKGEPGKSGISRRAALIGLATVGVVIVGGSTLSVISSPSWPSWLKSIRPKPTSTLFTYSGHSEVVNAVAWSPDGKRIASASFDGTVQIWEPLTGNRFLEYEGQQGGADSVAWSPNGKLLASVGLTVQIWDGMTGKTLLTYRGHNTMLTVAWSPDGTRLAAISDEVQVWEAGTGKSLYSIEYTGYVSLSTALTWSPDSKWLAAGPTQEPGNIYLYNAQTGAQVAAYAIADQSEEIRSVSWAPDGHALASGGKDQTVRVWDRTGKILSIYRGHQDWVNAVAWSPSSRRIASASEGQNDNTVHISDAATARQVYIYTGHSGSVTSASWSPDGKLLASGSVDTTVQVWRAP